MKKLIFKDTNKRQDLSSRVTHAMQLAEAIIEAYQATGLKPLSNIMELSELVSNMKGFICRRAIDPALLTNINLDQYYGMLTVPGLAELERSIQAAVGVHMAIEYGTLKAGKLSVDQVKLDKALNECDVYAQGPELQVYELVSTIKEKYDAIHELTGMRWRDIGTLYHENSITHEVTFDMTGYGRLIANLRKDN